MNEMEALQAMQAVIFDGSVALRHLRDVAEEQIPIFKNLLADQAVNVAASHEAIERAYSNAMASSTEFDTSTYTRYRAFGIDYRSLPPPGCAGICGPRAATWPRMSLHRVPSSVGHTRSVFL
jgi:hypothetical protein